MQIEYYMATVQILQKHVLACIVHFQVNSPAVPDDAPGANAMAGYVQVHAVKSHTCATFKPIATCICVLTCMHTVTHV